jgi:small subunit ribosomal protein S16
VVKIRLQRRGRKKLPVYKIVVADSRAPRNGRFIEALGQYTPLAAPAGITLDDARVMYWLGVGAQPTETVRSLLSREGIMLRLHLQRKGKSADEINQQVSEWRSAKQTALASKVAKKQLRAQRKKEAEAAPQEAGA